MKYPVPSAGVIVDARVAEIANVQSFHRKALNFRESRCSQIGSRIESKSFSLYFGDLQRSTIYLIDFLPTTFDIAVRNE